MYQNKAILIGFLGGDAEVRTGKNNQKFEWYQLLVLRGHYEDANGTR
jgi:single-strand DNA-binding protein